MPAAEQSSAVVDMAEADIAAVVQRLTPTMASNIDVITLAKLRGVAIESVPKLISIAADTEDRRFLGICLDSLSSILRNSDHPYVSDATRILVRLLENPDYRRIRHRIAWTLLRIGPSAYEALPALGRIWRSGIRSSVRVPVRSGWLLIGWAALIGPDEARAAVALKSVVKIPASYRDWIIDELLKSNLGTARTRTIAVQIQTSIRSI